MSDVKRRVQHGSLYISKSNGTIRTYPLRLLRQLPISSSGRLRSRIQAHAYSVPESPQSIEKVKVVLERNIPGTRPNGRVGFKTFPSLTATWCCFMQAARWADDIRLRDKQHHRGPWHYINFPFKPKGQPDSVQTREPELVNILTAMADNQRIVANETDPERKTIA